MAQQFKVRRVTVDPGAWTDVSPPQNCDNVLVNNFEGSGTLRIREDKTDATTELTLPVGSERLIAAAANMENSSRRTRFRAGEVAFSLKPDSGTGPIVLVWA